VSVLEVLARTQDLAKQTILANRIAKGNCTVRDAEELLRTLEQYPSEPLTPTATPTTVPTPTSELVRPCEGCANNPNCGGTYFYLSADGTKYVCDRFKTAEVVLVGTAEHYGKTTVPFADMVKVRAVIRPLNVQPPGVDWRAEYRDSGVLMSKPITEECGLELEKLGIPVERIEVAKPAPPPPVRTVEAPTAQPSAEQGPPSKPVKPKEIDLDATHKFCPICGDPMTVTAYERLKKKFESVTETVASLFKGPPE